MFYTKETPFTNYYYYYYCHQVLPLENITDINICNKKALSSLIWQGHMIKIIPLLNNHNWTIILDFYFGIFIQARIYFLSYFKIIFKFRSAMTIKWDFHQQMFNEQFAHRLLHMHALHAHAWFRQWAVKRSDRQKSPYIHARSLVFHSFYCHFFMRGCWSPLMVVIFCLIWDVSTHAWKHGGDLLRSQRFYLQSLLLEGETAWIIS